MTHFIIVWQLAGLVLLVSACGGGGGGSGEVLISGANVPYCIYGTVITELGSEDLSSAKAFSSAEDVPFGYVPVSGVQVEIGGVSDITDSSGRYFMIAGRNEKTITFRKNDYVTLEDAAYPRYHVDCNSEDRYTNNSYNPNKHAKLIPQERGALTVTSAPAGATIFIDGHATLYTTPATLSKIKPGPHEISAVLQNQLTSGTNQLQVDANGVYSLDLALQTLQGVLATVYPLSGNTTDSFTVLCSASDSYQGEWEARCSKLDPWTALSSANTLECRYQSSNQYYPGCRIAGVAVDAANPVFIRSSADNLVYWQKHFGSTGTDTLTAMSRDSDGQYIAGGLKFVSGSGTFVWLLKWNDDGDMTWDKVFTASEDIKSETEAISVSNNGYLLTTSALNEVDRAGNILWHMQDYSDDYVDMSQLPDGGYIATSNATIYLENIGASADIVLHRLDSSYNEIWSRNFFVQPSALSNDYALDFINTDSGDFAISGYTQPKTTHIKQGMILKINQTGALSWIRVLDTEQNAYVNTIRQTPDGGYVAAGTQENNNDKMESQWDALFVRLDSSGNVIWQTALTGPAFFTNEEIQSIEPTVDGGYIATGSMKSSDDKSDLLLVKLDANGTVEYVKAYGGVVRTNEYGIAVFPQSDGAFLVAGNTKFYGANQSVDAWLLKLDAHGN